MSDPISVNYSFKNTLIPLKKVFLFIFTKLVGGLIINDKDASNTRLVIEIMKNLSKKVCFICFIYYY